MAARRPALPWIAAALAVAAIVAIVLVARSGGDASTAPGPATDTVARAAPDRPPTAARRAPVAPDVTGDPALDFDLDQQLSNYLVAARFPPTSRPLDPGQVDLLRPHARHEGPVPTRTPARGEQPDPENTYVVLFTADRYFVTGDDDVVATLKVWKGTTPGPGVAVSDLGATLVAIGDAGEEEIASPAFEAVREDGGVAYRASFDPTPGKGAAAGTYRLRAAFTAPDGTQATGEIDFFVTPRERVPARFTGRFRERLEDGSLVIAAQVDVATAGRYEIEANLFDARDQPIASALFSGELAAGKQDVDLLFFGLIFHERQASGRFTLRDLRGYRFSPGESPDRAMMASYAGEHRTASYALDAFSSAEWDAPEKQAQIEMYQQAIRDQQGGSP